MRPARLPASDSVATAPPPVGIDQAHAAVVQLGDLLDERQAEAGALLRRRGPRQRIELLEHLALGVLGNARARGRARDVDHAAAPLERERDRPPARREVERVVDQVGERAAAAGTRRRRTMASPRPARSSTSQAARRAARLRAAARPLPPARAGRPARRASRLLPRLERGQLHHPVDQLLDALRLAHDVGDEAAAVGVGHRLLQQLGGAADRRQRALHLVRQRLHVVGDVVAAGERVAHLVVGGADRAERAPAEPRQAEASAARARSARSRRSRRTAAPARPRGSPPAAAPRPPRSRRRSSVLRRAASTNWPKLCTGLPTLTAPMIARRRRRVADRRGDVHHRGARVAFDVGRGARAVAGRAARGGRRASASGRRRRARPRESNTTVPLRSTTVMRSSTRVFSMP